MGCFQVTACWDDVSFHFAAWCRELGWSWSSRKMKQLEDKEPQKFIGKWMELQGTWCCFHFSSWLKIQKSRTPGYALSLPGGKYAWVDTIVLGYIIWKCTWQEGKHHCWRCRDRQRWFAWPTCKGPAKILMQLAFIPQGDWEVYETMDSCTCPQPTQPTRSRKNKKAQGGLINRKSHGGWSMKDSNILTTFLAHGWATSGTQTFCAFTKLANINTLLTRFFSQLLVFGLGKAQFTQNHPTSHVIGWWAFFSTCFFFQSAPGLWCSKVGLKAQVLRRFVMLEKKQLDETMPV